MRFDDIESLLGAYALDALDDDERAAVERYLATHPRARAEVAAHREVATMLGYTGAAAPEGLWERIASALEEAPPEPGPELARVMPTPPPPPRIHPWRRAVIAGLAVAAAAAAVIVPLGIAVRDQDREPDESALVELYDEARAAPGTRRTELASPDGAVTLPAVVGADGVGYLEADTLPPLPEDRTYQLWAVFPDRVVSLGVLGPDPGLTAFRTGPEAPVLAVTNEQAGGVTETQETPLAVGQLA